MAVKKVSKAGKGKINKVTRAAKGQRRRCRRERKNREMAAEAALIHIDSESSNDGIEVLDQGGVEVLDRGGVKALDQGGIEVLDQGGIEALDEDADEDEIQLLDVAPSTVVREDQSPIQNDNPCMDNFEPPFHPKNNNPELSDFHNAEIKSRNQANDLVNYYDLSIEDKTSDDDSDESEDKDEPYQDIWPIFAGDISASTIPEAVKHRQLKSG
jgi:hypothetical protein